MLVGTQRAVSTAGYNIIPRTRRAVSLHEIIILKLFQYTIGDLI